MLKCHKINQPFEPISACVDLTSFKLYMGDIGLLVMKSGISQQTILAGDGNLFMGAVTENYIAQQLVAQGYELHYCESASQAEIDFVLQKDNQIIGLEVKRGEHVRSRNLRVFLDSYKQTHGIRLSLKNFGQQETIKSVPLYAAFCL